MEGDVDRANGLPANLVGDEGRSSFRGAGGIDRPLPCREVRPGVDDEKLGERAALADDEEAAEEDEARLLVDPNWPSAAAARGDVVVDPTPGDLCSSDALCGSSEAVCR